MVERESVRHLRGLGAIGAAAIIGVLLLQAVVLVVLSVASAPGQRSVNASGMRRQETMRVLYLATVRDDAGMRETIADLRRIQGNFNDLAPDESALFERFLAHPNRADGFALVDVFDRKTREIESGLRNWRMQFRTFATVVDLLAIMLTVVLYFRLVRPMEDRWANLVNELDGLSRRMEAMAYLDPMTELPNRRYAMEHLRPAIARAERRGECIAAYFIDLDGFKHINDTIGHEGGDEFLKLTAARLRGVLREGDILARIGGDEFLALQFDVADSSGVLLLGERLVAAASEPAILEGRPVQAGASVGVALYPRDAVSAEELIDRADRAMYASKRAGKGRVTVV